MPRPTKIVGITGGIGSGKTTVCKIFELLGVPIYFADDRAKYIMNEDTTIRKQITATFGDAAYKEGLLNRKYMASKVFNDSEEVKKLNSIVHPAVAKDFDLWNSRQNSEYILKEAALLIESGSYKSLDFLITICASEEVRIERIKKRDPFRTEDEIIGIISKQVSEATRQKLADLIIKNNESELLIPQVLKAHDKLKN